MISVLKRFKKYSAIVLGVSVLSYLASCSSSSHGKSVYSQNLTCEKQPTYAVDIKPIMDASCVSCHNNARRTDGVSVSDFAGTKDCFANGAGLCSVHHDCSPMPRNAPKLTDKQLNTLKCWVKNGCKE